VAAQPPRDWKRTLAHCKFEEHSCLVFSGKQATAAVVVVSHVDERTVAGSAMDRHIYTERFDREYPAVAVPPTSHPRTTLNPICVIPLLRVAGFHLCLAA